MGQSRYLSLRRSDVCADCGYGLDPGDRAWWDADARSVSCGACRPEVSAPGASAQRIGDARFVSRDRRTRENHRITGGLRMALSETPQSERAWSTGADGERRLGGMLDGLRSERIRVLHDRGVPGSTANIDHVVIAPSGVYVIDAKNYRGKFVTGRLHSGPSALIVGGRPRPKLIEGMTKQLVAVTGAVPATVPVVPVVCFIDAQWQLFNKSFAVAGVRVCAPKILRRWVTKPGAIGSDEASELERALLRKLRAS